MCLSNKSNIMEAETDMIRYKFVYADDMGLTLPIIGKDNMGMCMLFFLSEYLKDLDPERKSSGFYRGGTPMYITECYNKQAEEWPTFGYGSFETPEQAWEWGSATTLDQKSIPYFSASPPKHSMIGVVIPVKIPKGTLYFLGKAELGVCDGDGAMASEYIEHYTR